MDFFICLANSRTFIVVFIHNNIFQIHIHYFYHFDQQFIMHNRMKHKKSLEKGQY